MKALTIGVVYTLFISFLALSSCGSSDKKPANQEIGNSASSHCANHHHLSFPDGAHGLRNCATLQNCGDNTLLNLGNHDGYYAMGVEAGKFIQKLNSFSFAVCYNIGTDNQLEGYGHFIFACSELAENGPDEGPYIAYRLNEQRFEISTGGYMHEEAIMMGTPSATGKWVVAIYRQEEHLGELFIDGISVGKNEFMPYPSDLFKNAPDNTWIGRAPFKGDKYLTDTKIRFLNLYDYALSDEEVKRLSKL